MHRVLNEYLYVIGKILIIDIDKNMKTYNIIIFSITFSNHNTEKKYIDFITVTKYTMNIEHSPSMEIVL